MIEWLANDSINTQYQGMVDLMEMDLYFFSCNNLPDDASFHKASVAWLISQSKKSRCQMKKGRCSQTPKISFLIKLFQNVLIW